MKDDELFQSLLGITIISNQSDDTHMVMVGRLRFWETVQIQCSFKLDDYKLYNVYDFMCVWGEVNDDVESDHKKEKMLKKIYEVENNFSNDPRNKKILDTVDEEQRHFDWSYKDEKIDKFSKGIFSTSTPEQRKKCFDDNWTEHYKLSDLIED